MHKFGCEGVCENNKKLFLTYSLTIVSESSKGYVAFVHPIKGERQVSVEKLLDCDVCVIQRQYF